MNKINLAFAVATPLAATVTLTLMRPALAVSAFTTFTCATVSACVIGNNTSSGPGVQGTSALGEGVTGQAKFNSTTSANGQAGVLGQDLSASGIFNAGVSGTSVRGVGVRGTSSSNAGVSGISTSATGVRGTSTSASGVVATTNTGPQAILGQGVTTVGVAGRVTSSGTGVLASTPNGVALNASAHSGIGVEANGNIGLIASDAGVASHVTDLFVNGFGAQLVRVNNSHGVDVLTTSNFGITNAFAITAGSGAVGTGVNSNGGYAGVQGSAAAPTAYGVQGNNTNNAASVAVRANGFGGPEFVGNGSNGVDNFVVDNSGNVFAHSFNATLSASTRTANGGVIQTYSHETRSPTIEDFGEAALTSGQAYVRLDSGFSSALVPGVPYFVFITPLGPTRGMLYVSQRTQLGFYVHESGVPGSSVAFDYRVVGKRFIPASAPQVLVTTHAAKTPPSIPTFAATPKERPAIPH